jgi:dTDP-glucose pyrophosphorylase
MLNIVIPMVGINTFDTAEYKYPKPLIEILGKPLLQLVVDCLNNIKENKRFIFIVNSSDCFKYHLDSILQLITNNQAVVIKLEKDTKGAACSVLMAVDYINNDDPMLISSSDHIIEYDLDKITNHFISREIDAGVVCFESVHPKWSFVRIDENFKIIETAEKRPLSKNAIAGLYYFRHGFDFVKATMNMIKKDAHVNGLFYIAPALNELVLLGSNMEIYKIPVSAYHNFYSPHKFKEYENRNKQ